MKLEKVNDTQILWSLDRDDLIQNEINVNDFLTGSPKARSMFQEAMRQAERDLRFQIDGHMLYCQLQELNEDKVTFAITKREMIQEIPHLICEFDSLDDVIGVSKLLNKEMPLKNNLYKLEGSYVLLLDPDKEDEKQVTWCTVSLTEFASVEIVSKPQRAFLMEHGECIVEGEALQKLRLIA